MQRTLILVKPDAIEHGLVGTILARFERAGLRLEECRWVCPTLSLLQTHYADLRVRNAAAFDRTVRFLANQPFVAVVLTGPNAILKARTLAGATDPCAAAPGTIRGDFSSDTIHEADRQDRATCNLIHAADSEASAIREIALWFSQA